MKIGQNTVGQAAVNRRGDASPSRRAGYTLMELLVVMGIIAILAGLTVVVLPAVKERIARGMATSKLKEIAGQVGVYYGDFNAYPPDNPRDPSRPPLFYELTGTAAQTQAQADGTETVLRYALRIQVPGPSFTPAEIETMFGRKGFRNSGEDGKMGPTYLPSIKAREYATDPADPLPDGRRPSFLGVPIKGPDGDFSRFHYNSSNPTNNPGTFDLEVRIMPRKEVISIRN